MESSVLNMPSVIPIRCPSGNVMSGVLRKSGLGMWIWDLTIRDGF